MGVQKTKRGDFAALIKAINHSLAERKLGEDLLSALESAKKYFELHFDHDRLQAELESERSKSKRILQASIELSEERDIQKLCNKILSTMRSLVHAEGASLYLVSGQELIFSHVQNEVFNPKFKGARLPLDATSMAGACAIRRQIIHVPDAQNITDSFRMNTTLDEKTGYQTRSALCFPLLKTNQELVGVIQLINSKRESGFSDEDIGIGRALSGSIAISLETSLLYKNIEELFEGFIKASVVAIESRDPTTSGHSERVADLTLNLARAVTDSDAPVFRHIRFNEKHLKEIRYAALLHDFGKIGVPEAVLLKETKLYPHELTAIEHRLKLLMVAHPNEQKELKELWSHILEANKPSVVHKDIQADLDRWLNQKRRVLEEELSLLTSDEWKKLTITKGSLSPEDRAQIESHVSHTYRFLKQIPWTRELARIPDIAHAHHEKLDGSGYPQKLHAQEIPFESQMMAITDIYDALTAHDRPYKRAVPIPRAIEIIRAEALARKLNQDLVELFAAQCAKPR